MSPTIRSIYPLTLIEGQGMGTAYEYYSKLRVMQAVFSRTGLPRSLLAVGLPEKHGFDLDFVLLAHLIRMERMRQDQDDPHCSLVVCEDRPEVLAAFRQALQQLPDPAMREGVELVQVATLTDWSALAGRRFDWAINTASMQRLPDSEIVTYIRNARQMAHYAFLFIPNLGNRAHLTLSGLRGLELETALALSRRALGSRAGRPPIIAAGYCDIPPFPPGLERSPAAKEQALHNPIETLAMWMLGWWCRGEALIPRPLKRRFAHLVHVALDLREPAA